MRSARRAVVVGGCALSLGLSGGCQKEGPPAPPFAPEALGSLSYPNLFAEGGLAHLEGGRYEDPTTGVVVQLDSLHAFGDLDGDRAPDAAVLLVSQVGATTSGFVELNAVRNVGGMPEPAAHLRLDDGSQVEALAIADGRLVVTLRTLGPNDPLDLPTLRVRQTYTLEAGALTLRHAEDLGRTRPADAGTYDPLAPADTNAVGEEEAE